MISAKEAKDLSEEVLDNKTDLRTSLTDEEFVGLLLRKIEMDIRYASAYGFTWVHVDMERLYDLVSLKFEVKDSPMYYGDYNTIIKHSLEDLGYLTEGWDGEWAVYIEW